MEKWFSLKYKKPKFKKDNKMRAFGQTDVKTGVIKINKRLIKNNPDHKKRHPELADTIYHETLHIKHPKMTERSIRKKTTKDVKRMSRKQKAKLYAKI